MARSHCCAVVVTASTPWSSARSATTPSDAGAHDRHAAYFLALAVAQVYNFLGQVRLTKGDPDAAARLFTKGLTAARRASERLSILISLYDLALSSQAWGDLSGAAEHLTEGLSLAAEAGDQTSAAYYLEALAAVASSDDNPQRAAEGRGGLHGHALDGAFGRETARRALGRAGHRCRRRSRLRRPPARGRRPWSPARSPGRRGPRPSPGRARRRARRGSWRRRGRTRR